jgi:hypothetical protein
MEIAEQFVIPAVSDRTWRLVIDPQHVRQCYAFGGAEIEREWTFCMEESGALGSSDGPLTELSRGHREVQRDGH